MTSMLFKDKIDNEEEIRSLLSRGLSGQHL